MDFNPTGIKWAGHGYGTVEFGRDDQLVVFFYTKSVRNDAKSRDANRTICEDVPYVKIFTPGERLNQIDRPVQEDDKRRWPRQWSDYVHNRTQTPEGTPIDLLFPNHPAVAENMRALGVYTVEQCAKLSSHALDTIGIGAQEYQNKAKAYLDSSNKGAGFNKLNDKLAKKDQEIRILQQQLAMQKKQIDDLTNRIMNPGAHSLSPPWQQGYDVQTDRINKTHPTQEIAKKAKSAKLSKKPRAVEVDDENMLGNIED